MTIAIYPGSFDPITNGHTDIIETGSKLFDKVIVAVLHNISKTPMLSINNRINLIKESTQYLPNVEVLSFDELTVNLAKKMGANVIIRGLRTASDFEYEMQLSQANYSLEPNIPTVFLMTKPQYSFITSSLVKDVFKNNGNISNFVPNSVVKFLTES